MPGFVNFLSDAELIHQAYPTYSGDLAFDIGANGGMVAKIFAERFTKVVACEPAAESFKVLEDYCPGNVVPVNMAVSSGADTVTLRETTLTEQLGELFTGDTLSWGDHLGTRTVPATTLDKMVRVFGRPSFIKVDTEGHEEAVLAGGPLLFLEPIQFIIEVHDVRQGERIKANLTALDHTFEVIRQEKYHPASEAWKNHYWLVGQ